MNPSLRLAWCAIFLFMLPGCGYGFQGRYNPLRELGVEKIYVTQFRNKTFRPGVEQLFSTAMIREIRKSGSFRLVNSESDADAVLSGEVTGADVGISSSKSIEVAQGKSVDVATEYSTGIQCNVELQDRRKRVIFSQTVSNSKIYPGATGNTEETGGPTNSLVNDSEQRLAIQFLASQMMASVYQRMIDTF